MTVTHDDDWFDLLGAYALGAIETEEGDAIRVHLDGCDACAERVQELLEVAGQLAPEVVPPPAVWDRVRDEINAGGARQATRFGPSKHRWLLGAAAVVLLVAGLAVGRVTTSDESRTDLSELASAAERAPGSRTVGLSSPSGALVATVVIPVSGPGFLLADGLDAVDAGQTYQLWAVTSEGTVSIAILGNHPEVVALGAPGPFDALAITVEPASGSVVATGEAIAATA